MSTTLQHTEFFVVVIFGLICSLSSFPVMRGNVCRLTRHSPIAQGSSIFSKQPRHTFRIFNIPDKPHRTISNAVAIGTSLRTTSSEDHDKARRATFLASIQESLVNDVLTLFKEKQDSPTKMIVGVSGGCDSIALLHALHKLSLTRLEVHAVHFDHHQRGIESDGDREFVVQQCSDLEIPLHIYHWENDACEKFSQDKARIWRRRTMYDLLESLVPKGHRGIIATAHHKNDSVETLLLKLLRGVHINNLRGMEVVSLPSDQPNAVWARPLLKATKDEIKHFLQSQALQWREDSSNTLSKYKRNRVRNELIPLMADIVGDKNLLEKRLENLSRQSKDLSHELDKQAQNYLHESESNDFFILPKGTFSFVHKEALYRWCRSKGISLSYDNFERISSQLEDYPTSIQWTLQVGDGHDIMRRGSAIYVERADGKTFGEPHPRELMAWSIVKEPNQFSRETLHLRVLELPQGNYFKVFSAEVFRSPFRPSWRADHNPIKLKDFLRGQKIPLHLRQNIPVVLSAEDNIVAVQCNKRWIVDAKYCPLANKEGFLIELDLSH